MTPFCCLCGRDRPEGRTETHCVPCANAGHNGRIIEDMDDLWRSISIWADYYRHFKFTPEQLRSIPVNRKRAMAAAVAIGDMKLYHMLMGECVVCTEEQLDNMASCLDVASCVNRRRVGIRDQYVAWIIHPPSDLEHLPNMTAIGSGKYTSELEHPHEAHC